MAKNILSIFLVICGLIVGLTLLDIINIPLFYPYAGIIISTTVLLIILFKNRKTKTNSTR
jgi:hypothetical protein